VCEKRGVGCIVTEHILDEHAEGILEGIGQASEKCPFEFNFDPETFKPGDFVSYRIPERFGEMPFVGTILAVFEGHVEISPNDPSDPDRRMRGTRESRPVVSAAAALD
jgi:hypothetical protein